jgi:hypothetical protein
MLMFGNVDPRHPGCDRRPDMKATWSIDVNRAQIENLLAAELGLVTDPRERGEERSYFFGSVVWAPACTTRIVRLYADQAGEVTQIGLCRSSDNNNSVFVQPPFDSGTLRAWVAAEIALFERQRAAG